MSDFEKPRWLRDLLRFLPLKSQFVLSGNIADLQVLQLEPEAITTVALYAALSMGCIGRAFSMFLPLTLCGACVLYLVMGH